MSGPGVELSGMVSGQVWNLCRALFSTLVGLSHGRRWVMCALTCKDSVSVGPACRAESRPVGPVSWVSHGCREGVEGMATPAERVEAAGRWLVSVGGLSTPGDLGAALGLNHARQADVVRALRDGGLVDGPQKELRLTPAGWAMFSTPDAEGGEVLARVLNACLPQWAYGHAAYARLLVSATVAKGHLFATRPDDHLSLIALGPQGTGKTFLARLVCEVLGLDWRRHLVQLDDETRGSLRGRRGQVGDEGWRLESAAWAGLPLVVFDEIDKAPPAARTAVWRYLRGQGVVYVEGEPHEVRPVAMVAGNPPEGAAGDPARALLPEGTRRRSVILSTGYVGGRTGELAERIDAGMRSLTPADRLALARLRPPLVELPVEVRAVLREAGRMVTPAHGPTPFLGLEAAALGRLALAGGDPMAATVGTLVDYLAVTGTTPGMVDPGWLARAAGLRAWVADGGHGDVAGVLESIERGQDAARSASRELRVSRAAAGDELVRDRAVMVAHLDRAAAALDGKVTRSWPAPVKIDAASIRAVLVRLREDAAASRSREALEDVRARSLPYGAQVDELTRGAQAAREMAELQAAQERKQIEWDRNAQREGGGVPAPAGGGPADRGGRRAGDADAGGQGAGADVPAHGPGGCPADGRSAGVPGGWAPVARVPARSGAAHRRRVRGAGAVRDVRRRGSDG